MGKCLNEVSELLICKGPKINQEYQTLAANSFSIVLFLHEKVFIYLYKTCLVCTLGYFLLMGQGFCQAQQISQAP